MLNEYMSYQDAQRWREALKKFMGWYGINANQWCKISGVPYSTLNGFMTGAKNNITYGTLEKLARSVGVTVGVIMGEVGMRDSATEKFKHATPEELEILESLRKIPQDKRGIYKNILKSGADDTMKTKPKIDKRVR